MEHIVNQIILTGNLAGAPRYSHENHGRRFYAFPLEVERLSGTTDTLPVLAAAGASGADARGRRGYAVCDGADPLL